ncbi:MAG: nucleotidyltransferase family protein [Nitrospirae bacterium]|nr:nucleotidyltransferase family protein [Nitrospirota bacterium]
MRALLLAAGLGTRLRPLTTNIPKCLVPIYGRPLIYYWLKMLIDAGVHPVLVNLHYLADKVRDYIRTSDFNEVVSLVYEENLLGTAGTLLRNRAFFNDEPLMLIHADNLSKFDVRAFIERHNSRPVHCEMTMMTFHTAAPESCGIVELDDSGVVKAFHEKEEYPPGNLANGAVYILEPGIFGFLEKIGREVIDFSTEVLPHYVGRIFTFHNGVYHMDIGTMDNYLTAIGEFRQFEGKI